MQRNHNDKDSEIITKSSHMIICIGMRYLTHSRRNQMRSQRGGLKELKPPLSN